ncbi:DnaJ domain-containing protein, putative [Eimeria tenella]|uniref:DnaJ domain-containing protein, putative n=1 Tax=Eimeria tenella TaxID=5802 RepID=U6KLA6_EIMTE|nr:DnaJ domain-containing protein, putative [Eimeria tenella]CDJ37047.1 DnaJ domain-containing protein, putative [Eimeria tenella]|eukprot:XP_013227885.1 DnaJ domain-containing protein, putative [Eimeria tenella]
MEGSQWSLPAGLKGQCPYTVLGLCLPENGSPVTVQEAAADLSSVESREALSLKAIGTAYRRAALRAHPDKNKGRETEAAAAFLIVNLAFAYLSSREQREGYHRHLRTLLALREQREQQQLRWTEKDRERQRFKAELERREAEARRGPKVNIEEEKLREIRERNEALLRQRCEADSQARRDLFKDNSARLLLQRQQHQSSAACSPTSGETVQGEEFTDDILKRSVLLSWPPEPALASDRAPGANNNGGTAAAAAVDAYAPTPASLCAELYGHGAVDLCLFSRAKGLACVSFSSRERAIEAALLLQRQSKEKRERKDRPTVKLADKAKGFEKLFLRIRNAAGASDQLQQNEANRGTPTASEPAEHAEADELDEEVVLGIARETEEAAGAFAAALAAEQAAATATADMPLSTPVTASLTKSNCSVPLRSSSSSTDSTLNDAEARHAATAFGLDGAMGCRPTSAAAARILEYVKSCGAKGLAAAEQQQAEAEEEEGWEWLGGSKVAASMSMQQLEVAAFGELQRKKKQQEQAQTKGES